MSPEIYNTASGPLDQESYSNRNVAQLQRVASVLGQHMGRPGSRADGGMQGPSFEARMEKLRAIFTETMRAVDDLDDEHKAVCASYQASLLEAERRRAGLEGEIAALQARIVTEKEARDYLEKIVTQIGAVVNHVGNGNTPKEG